MVSTTCASWPSCSWSWRAIRKFQSWSLPPSSTSASTITESQPCSSG